VKTENSNQLDYTAGFLIAEFNVLNERAKAYEEIKSSRVNFFLLVVAAAGAIFSALSQNDQFRNYDIAVIRSLSGFIFLLGVFILTDMTSYSMAVVTQYRRAGRVRRWFVDHNSELAEYVAYSPTDDKPPYTDSFSELHWRGAETIILLLNCLSFLILVVTILHRNLNILLNISLIVAVVCAVLFWFAQIAYVYLRMKGFQKSDFAVHNIHFPTEK
jgi:hypothetical protein